MSTAGAALNGPGYYRMPHSVENKTLGVVRRSTPDSEGAVLSSDDDHEPNASMSMSLHSAKSMPAQPPIRRSSWLSEVRTAQRKYSLGGQSLASTGGNSQPQTPSAENGYTPRPLSSTDRSDRQSHTSMSSVPDRPTIHAPLPAPLPASSSSLAIWETTTGRPSPNPSTWATHTGSPMWSKKEFSRWSELPSQHPSTFSHSQSALDELRSPTSQLLAEPSSSDTSPASIPFDIPLEPNRKTIRSQSYSAGQADFRHHQNNQPQEPPFASRFIMKRNQPPNLPRRKSKALLDEHNNLTAVEEDVNDGDVSSIHSGGGVALSSTYTSPRMGLLSGYPGLPAGGGVRLDAYAPLSNEPTTRQSIQEAYAPSSNEMALRQGTQHAYAPSSNETSFRQGAQDAYALFSSETSFRPSAQENLNPEHLHMSGLSLGGPSSSPVTQTSASIPRYAHSFVQRMPDEQFVVEYRRQIDRFANIDRERRSLHPGENTVDPYAYDEYDNDADRRETVKIGQAAKQAQELFDTMNRQHDHARGQPEGSSRLLPIIQNVLSNSTELSSDVAPIAGFKDPGSFHFETIPATMDQAYDEAARIAGHPTNHHTEPSDNLKYMGGLGHRGDSSECDSLSPGPFNIEVDSLYLVTFKSNRADVFYVSGGFQPEPSPGDMVIVEADRGVDLGMVQFKGLSFEEAKIRKAEYNRLHYNTLVRFSRQFPNIARASQGDPILNEFAGFNKADQSKSRRDVNPVPKKITRIATDREIKLLREKEGNEAKAKRICQAKVNHRGIYMEVLDAEFQCDYKKLTFYFYAESYIDFNDIVCDLFKVWKTRIWMASVNPENYPAPPGAKEIRTEKKVKKAQFARERDFPANEYPMIASDYGSGNAMGGGQMGNPNLTQRYSIPELIRMGVINSQQQFRPMAMPPSMNSPMISGPNHGFGPGMAMQGNYGSQMPFPSTEYGQHMASQAHMGQQYGHTAGYGQARGLQFGGGGMAPVFPMQYIGANPANPPFMPHGQWHQHNPPQPGSRLAPPGLGESVASRGELPPEFVPAEQAGTQSAAQQ